MSSSLPTRIIIRCDGGTAIGMGHVIRCMALADMLKGDFQIHFVIQETAERVYETLHTGHFEYSVTPFTNDYAEDLEELKKIIQPSDIVVLDGYNFKTDYQLGVRKLGNKLVVIDDLHDWHQVADVVINHAGGVQKELYSAEKYTKFFLGYNFRMLRSEFLGRHKEKKIKESVHSVFISMGAADEHNNTCKFAKACLEFDDITEVDLMVSVLNPHLFLIDQLRSEHPHRVNVLFNLTSNELYSKLEKSDLVIAPASTISLESCAVGVGLLTGCTAINQNDNYKGLLQAKVCYGMDDLNNATLSEIENRILHIKNNIVQLNFLIKNQSVIFGEDPTVKFQSIFKSLIVESNDREKE